MDVINGSDNGTDADMNVGSDRHGNCSTMPQVALLKHCYIPTTVRITYALTISPTAFGTDDPPFPGFPAVSAIQPQLILANLRVNTGREPVRW
jgi:hypothetical protein